MIQRPIVYFFSDFGACGPYTGQVEALIRSADSDFVELVANAPATDPYHSAYLLAGLFRYLPVRCGYLLAVVDPGVGTQRGLLHARLGQMHIVAPDNGLLVPLLKHHADAAVAMFSDRPVLRHHSFHARDWFAPVLMQMIAGKSPAAEPVNIKSLVGADWPEQLAEVVYIDHYGNLISGLQADKLSPGCSLQIGKQCMAHGQTFASVPPGHLFWYENSMGLVEIAANQASAAELSGAVIGSKLTLDCGQD